MPHPAFEKLFTCYPDLIERMPSEFTTQQFILRLAHSEQLAYVEALFACREGGKPFMRVHKKLADQLKNHGDLIVRIEDKYCPDIFGHTQRCQKWKKRGGVQ